MWQLLMQSKGVEDNKSHKYIKNNLNLLIRSWITQIYESKFEKEVKYYS